MSNICDSYPPFAKTTETVLNWNKLEFSEFIIKNILFFVMVVSIYYCMIYIWGKLIDFYRIYKNSYDGISNIFAFLIFLCIIFIIVDAMVIFIYIFLAFIYLMGTVYGCFLFFYFGCR